MVGSIQQVGSSASVKSPVAFQGDKQDPLKQVLTPDVYGKDEYVGKKKGKAKKLIILAAVAVAAALLLKKANILDKLKGLNLDKIKETAQGGIDKAKEAVGKTAEKTEEVVQQTAQAAV